MNGYMMMGQCYKDMVKRGKIDKETGEKNIRIYEFLANCDSDDICRLGLSTILSKHLLKRQ